MDAAASGSGSPSPPLVEFERDSPVDVSSTSEAGSTGGAGQRTGSPLPKNPQLVERWSSEEMRHIQCHLETKELWDKFNELGTEMIITKTGRYVVDLFCKTFELIKCNLSTELFGTSS